MNSALLISALAENYFHHRLEPFDLLIENDTEERLFSATPVPDPELAPISTDPPSARGLQKPLPAGRLCHRRTRTSPAGPNVSISNTSQARIRKSDKVSVAFAVAYPFGLKSWLACYVLLLIAVT